MERFKRKPYINNEDNKVDNKEQERLEKRYDFKKEDIMKDIRSYFTAENESANSTE